MNRFSNTFLREVLQDKGYIRGPFGSSLLRSELISSGIPVYEQQHAIRGIREFRFFIGEKKYLQLKRFSTLPGDLIISCSGTVGEISMITKDDPKGIISQALLILRTNPEVMIPDFLRYFLITRQGKHAITTASHGSVQVNIAPRKVVENIELPLPKIRDQKVISHILGTLDKKIELNNKTKETLEEIAKALFKSWFIDFDPVRAKAEGRSTGLSYEISNLFPDSFENSELGEIPNGWQVGGLDKFLILQRGFDLPSKQRIKGKYPVVAASGISGSHNVPKASAPGVVTGRSGLLGKVFYIQKDFFPLNTTLWVKEFYLATPVFSYFLLRTIDFNVFNAGSAVPTLNRNHLCSLSFSLPPVSLIHHFTEITTPLMERIQSTKNENETLITLRDTLLPKLISGEVRVSDAENMLEEVGI